MKIGDAGEAFFVFETDEDVPEELITSPLLQATSVSQSIDPADTTKDAGHDIGHVIRDPEPDVDGGVRYPFPAIFGSMLM